MLLTYSVSEQSIPFQFKLSVVLPSISFTWLFASENYCAEFIDDIELLNSYETKFKFSVLLSLLLNERKEDKKNYDNIRTFKAQDLAATKLTFRTIFFWKSINFLIVLRVNSKIGRLIKVSP